jgi:crossover junction endodeoxyribonuclease RuvC
MLAPPWRGISVAEYAPNVVKKSVLGEALRKKDQVKHMVKVLLPRAELNSADSIDALAIAICHAHHRGYANLAKILARS